MITNSSISFFRTQMQQHFWAENKRETARVTRSGHWQRSVTCWANIETVSNDDETSRRTETDIQADCSPTGMIVNSTTLNVYTDVRTH